MSSAPSQKKSQATLSLNLLIALVIGSMIGSGIFNLPQNMAVKASGGAILLGWLTTGFGMLMLCLVYQTLAIKKPELNNGVYAYASALCGEFMGFNSAWGYWISAWLGNVSFLIAVFGALGYFFPAFGEGNTLLSVFCASLALWMMHAFILKGIKTASFLNALITIAKIIPLLLFISLTIMAFRMPIFKANFYSPTSSFMSQVKNTMLVTVWVFIGIEGASVYSARARKPRDVGKATISGFIVTLLLLMAVSVLSLGILPQAQLAAMVNISMAGILQSIVGQWGAIIVVVGLLISVGGALLAWTLLAAEALFTPAKDGLLPRFLSQENSHAVPANTLWLTNGLVQIFLLITLFSKATYLTLILLATSMILIPYLFSALYAVKIAPLQSKDFIIGLLASGYCFWLLYAAGLKYLLLSGLLYLPGIVFYVWAKQQAGKPIFRAMDWWVLIIISAFSMLTIYLLASGRILLGNI